MRRGSGRGETRESGAGVGEESDRIGAAQCPFQSVLDVLDSAEAAFSSVGAAVMEM